MIRKISLNKRADGEWGLGKIATIVVGIIFLFLVFNYFFFKIDFKTYIQNLLPSFDKTPHGEEGEIVGADEEITSEISSATLSVTADNKLKLVVNSECDSLGRWIDRRLWFDVYKIEAGKDLGVGGSFGLFEKSGEAYYSHYNFTDGEYYVLVECNKDSNGNSVSSKLKTNSVFVGAIPVAGDCKIEKIELSPESIQMQQPFVVKATFNRLGCQGKLADTSFHFDAVSSTNEMITLDEGTLSDTQKSNGIVYSKPVSLLSLGEYEIWVSIDKTANPEEIISSLSTNQTVSSCELKSVVIGGPVKVKEAFSATVTHNGYCGYLKDAYLRMEAERSSVVVSKRFYQIVDSLNNKDNIFTLPYDAGFQLSNSGKYTLRFYLQSEGWNSSKTSVEVEVI